MLKKTPPKITEHVVIKTPFSKIALVFESGVLVNVDFFSRRALLSPESDAAKNASQQIKDFCSKKLPHLEFNIILQLKGTSFQKQVWRALQKIPAGQVLSYGELAQQLKTSARAVGNACRANPIPLVIPCHRVVSKTTIGGYMGSIDGAPMKIKQWLLAHEEVVL